MGQLEKRFIPVHTGNMFRCGRIQCIYPVYPCAYREHMTKNYNIGNIRGLSLCIQGTWRIPFSMVPPDRFIPVHTGNMI